MSSEKILGFTALETADGRSIMDEGHLSPVDLLAELMKMGSEGEALAVAYIEATSALINAFVIDHVRKRPRSGGYAELYERLRSARQAIADQFPEFVDRCLALQVSPKHAIVGLTFYYSGLISASVSAAVREEDQHPGFIARHLAGG
jgi:hypothetical protein